MIFFKFYPSYSIKILKLGNKYTQDIKDVYTAIRKVGRSKTYICYPAEIFTVNNRKRKNNGKRIR